MKKTIITLIISLIVGIIFGFYYFNNTKDNIVNALSKNNEVSAFQIGVYKNIDNAKKAINNNYGIIINDNDLYRVYIAILNDEENIIKLRNYYNLKHIYYYEKKIIVNDYFYNKLKEYEVLYKEASEQTIEDLNKEILKEYEISNNEIYD